MNENLSALMDDELEGVSADRLIDSLTSQEGLREAWRLYHVVGDAMRGTASADPSAFHAFHERLLSEPTVLCPGVTRARTPAVPVAWAAAASVAGIAVVVGAALGMQPPRGVDLARLDPVAMSRSATVSSMPKSGEDYLLAHQAVSGGNGLSGFGQYARTVAAVRSEGSGRR